MAKIVGEVAPGTSTEEPITINVDESDASGSVLTGLEVLTNQSDWDKALGSSSSFRYIEQVWRAFLGVNIQHVVTINVSGNVHHPQPIPASSAAFEVPKLNIVGEGRLVIQGSGVYTQDHPGGPVVGHQASSGDPYLDFAAATFPNDGSLECLFAVMDVGGGNTEIHPIHAHTDSRLRLTENIIGTPVSAFVGRPSSRLRNSLDDAIPFGGTCLSLGFLGGFVLRDFTDPNDLDQAIVFQDITLEHGGGSIAAINGSIECGMRMVRCHVKNDGIGTPDGRAFQLVLASSDITLSQCTFLGLNGTMDEVCLLSRMDGEFEFIQCVVKGYSGGGQIAMKGGTALMSNTVFIDGLGSAPQLKLTGARLASHSQGGSPLEFRNCLGGGMRLDECATRVTSGNGIEFRASDCGDSPLVIGPRTFFDIRNADAFQDGGGNSGFGIEIQGPGARVLMDSADAHALTGTSGDIGLVGRGGTISKTYAEVTSQGPLLDESDNYVERL